jgi:hypothetical protein
MVSMGGNPRRYRRRVSDEGRRATVVLTDGERVLGVLPPVPLSMPWWPEAADVVAAVRQQHGVDITVLRLVDAPRDRQWGGAVTYLAETEQRPPRSLEPWSGDDPLAEHPLRQEWARPGGPARLLGWAEGRLAEHGIHLTGPAEQMRSWNLSGIWRLPTTSGPVWLKAVPDFFAHEGAVMEWAGPRAVPPLHGWTRGRVLMAEVPGGPNHETRGAALEPMARLLTEVQERSLGRLDELRALGVPDRRLPLVQRSIEAVVEAQAPALTPGERAVVTRLVDTLPERAAAIDACGVPDALVHGDFHPGNVGGTAPDHRILDWGDSFIGNPLIDEFAFVQRLDQRDAASAREWFLTAWRRIAPGSDPERAVELLRPVLPLLAAVVYARFCAAIEPDERVYHRQDVVAMLRRAAVEGSTVAT